MGSSAYVDAYVRECAGMLPTCPWMLKAPIEPLTTTPFVQSAACPACGGAVPEVRWALIATGLFAVALVTQLAGAPTWLYWTLYLGCYATGGWEPGCSGLKAL